MVKVRQNAAELSLWAPAYVGGDHFGTPLLLILTGYRCSAVYYAEKVAASPVFSLYCIHQRELRAQVVVRAVFVRFSLGGS